MIVWQKVTLPRFSGVYESLELAFLKTLTKESVHDVSALIFSLFLVLPPRFGSTIPEQISVS